MITTRKIFILGLLTILGVLVASFYLEVIKGLQPCALCIMQRLFLMIVAVFFLLGSALPLKKCGAVFVSICATLGNIGGLIFAGRQVWLQHLPTKTMVDCGASLQFLLKALPFSQAMRKIFAGSSECSVVDWQLLYLSLAEWSLICFCFLLFLSVLALLSAWKRRA